MFFAPAGAGDAWWPAAAYCEVRPPLLCQGGGRCGSNLMERKGTVSV